MARRSGGSKRGGGKTVVRTPFSSTFKLSGNNAKRTAPKGRSTGKSR